MTNPFEALQQTARERLAAKEEAERQESIVYDHDPAGSRLGGLRVLVEKCSTCIFRPGNQMDLRDGRVEDLVSRAVAGGGYITCHATLPALKPIPVGEAVCRGFYDVHGDESNIIRVAHRLGARISFVPVPRTTAIIPWEES